MCIWINPELRATSAWNCKLNQPLQSHAQCQIDMWSHKAAPLIPGQFSIPVPYTPLHTSNVIDLDQTID